MQDDLKVLCFTTSYNRYKMLRGCISDIKQQTYKNIYHSVNIAYDKKNGDNNIKNLFDDFTFTNLKIACNVNSEQHTNYMNCFNNIDIDQYDLFIKIDDDDIYKKNYVNNIVEFFKKNKDIDITSSKFMYQLNGNKIYKGDYSNLGGNPEGTDFNMPPSFAFNRIALKSILCQKNLSGFEDGYWRTTWNDLGLKHKTLNNSENVIWHIHGKNISVSNFLELD